MKAKIRIALLSLMIAAACSKDNYNTTPKLTFKDVMVRSFQ